MEYKEKAIQKVNMIYWMKQILWVNVYLRMNVMMRLVLQKFKKLVKKKSKGKYMT